MSLLFHLSDLHFGREDKAALTWVKALVEAENPDAVIVTGDLTMRARSHEFAAAATWLKSLATPMTIEPGNHDIPVFNLWRRFSRPYERIETLMRAVEQPIALADVWLVPLNTTRRAQWRLNWASGAVSRSALDRAIDRLAKKPVDAIGLITCHHPLIMVGEMGRADRTLGGESALVELAAAGADAVLSGHVHDPFAMNWHNGPHVMRLIGAGTLSDRVRKTRPSFNQIQVRGPQLTVTHRIMDPS
jgi:3',5'-cyclic AMP phosphodiesterase CpdA